MDEDTQIADWIKVSALGSGGFGEVTLWKNTSNVYIAIKKCKFRMSTSLTPRQKSRWNNEVEIMKTIKHPNIVSFVDIPKDLEKGLLKNNPTKLPLLSMEYCRKGNLRHLLQKPQNSSGLEEGDIRCILGDISSGLQYLHNLNITHRDIKPENIVLQHCDERQGKIVYKIIDLGYAKELNDSTVSFVGTLHYLAPEIFETLNYDNSVDFWSLGITTFEIICGVLPFLPHLTPPERFADIQRKKSNDICIYVNYSGQVTYSTELKAEILITTAFKHHIEEWLQHVLHIDSVERAKDFQGGIKVLNYLQQILNKKIVKIFVLEKLEFHSFEIDERTTVGKLKDWISTKTAIQKSDLILLSKDIPLSDNQLTAEAVNGDNYVFVINRSCLIYYPVVYKFPKLIKEVMRSALEFCNKYVRQLCGQAVYYISTESMRANLFRCGLHYYLGYIKGITEKLRTKHISVSKKLGNLLVRINCCSHIRKHSVSNKDLSKNQMHEKSLLVIGKLLQNLQEHINAYREFKIKLNKTFSKLGILVKTWPEIAKLVNNFNLGEEYELIMSLLAKTDKGKNENQALLKSEITTMVSKSILIRETLFKNDRFKAFLSGMTNVQKNVENCLLWIQKFDKTIQTISQIYMEKEITYWAIHVSAANAYYKMSEKPPDSSISNENDSNFNGCDFNKEHI